MLPLRHGDISYVAVFWLPENASLTDYRTLGIYRNPDNPEEPGKLKIRAGDRLTGIDIQAVWGDAGG